MSLDVKQFRQYIVAPSLQAIDLWSEAAEELVTGTAMVESTLNYVKQIGGGPAVGLCQMEQNTYADLLNTLTCRYVDLYMKIRNALYMKDLPESSEFLIGNLCASVIFCRLKYYFCADPLPPLHDFAAMSAFHKKIYNTYKGDADIERNTRIFKSIVMQYPYHG